MIDALLMIDDISHLLKMVNSEMFKTEEANNSLRYEIR